MGNDKQYAVRRVYPSGCLAEGLIEQKRKPDARSSEKCYPHDDYFFRFFFLLLFFSLRRARRR